MQMHLVYLYVLQLPDCSSQSPLDNSLPHPLPFLHDRPLISEVIEELKTRFGEEAIELLDEDIVEIDFPVQEYLSKISSFNFDKTAEVSGILKGIKGQYLIFEHGVINMRKFTSYHVSAQVD